MIGVSGGGIAGLAVGLAILRNQKPLLFFSGSTPAKALVGGIQIAPNGWLALDQLGVGDAVRAVATDLKAITVRDMRSTATLASLDLSRSAYGSIARESLSHLLEAEITRLGGLKHIAANVTHAVQQGPDKNQGLHIINDNGGVHLVDALIAADGFHGFGRAYVNGLDPTKINQENFDTRVAMRAVAKATDLPKSFAQPFCNLWLGPGSHLVHYPINRGKDINLVLTLDTKNANSDWQQRYLAQNDILATLCNREDIKWVKTILSTQPFQDCWRRGRTVLAGDAAHPIPPNLAQGASQSLVDAASLMRWLRSKDLDTALSGYTQERSKAVSKIFKKAKLSSKIMAMDGVRANFRNIIVGLGGKEMLNKWLAEVWAEA